MTIDSANENPEMKNPVAHPVNPVFASRWSPYAYDPGREVSEADLQGMFEAARWTMSAFNAQPWRYIVGVRGRNQAAWDGVFGSLLEGNQGWTKNVPVLALGLIQENFEHNGKPNPTALHDLGAASAALTFEAVSRGLSVHQMSGIDPGRAREIFDLEEGIRPVTALAIGYAATEPDPEDEFAQRDQRPRQRKELDELIVRGGF